jgi:hypothetical protein
MAIGDELDPLGPTLKRSVATLRDADVPFLLAGSLACWARGGPRSENDLDFVVRPDDAERALQALADAGMRPERPPEEWLLKAWDGEVLVDLIFGPSGLELSDEVFERGEDIAVLAVTTPVMALEDVLTTKLLSLDEHSLDYGDLVGIARSLREQIDFEALCDRTEHSPYAKAFFTLVEGLGITEGSGAAVKRSPAASERHIRSVPGTASLPGERASG